MKILLESELNSGNRYRVFQDEYDKTRKTLMHYAAELGFLRHENTCEETSPADDHDNRRSIETCEEKSHVASGIGNGRRERQCGGIFDQSYVT